MKLALILFKSPNLSGREKSLFDFTEVFTDKGFTIDTVEILSNFDDLGFKRRLSELKDTADCLVVCDSEELNFNLKKIVSEEFNAPVVENDNAKTFLDTASFNSGKSYSEEYACIPEEATLIPNTMGAYQGYMIDDKELVLAVLPEEINQFNAMCGKYVLPYLESKSGKEIKKLTLKYVGDREKLEQTLSSAKESLSVDFTNNINEKNGDTTVNLIFNGSDSVSQSSSVIRYIVGLLKDDIYAEFDTTPEERIFDILKLKNLKLSTAESFTGGRVVSSIIKNSGASNYVNEGIVCYSNKSKEERLGVKKEDLIKSGAVSSIVAYEMAVGLLVKGDCDIAIATTGIAGPKSDDTDKPVGLCYIAVGMKDGVHTYKFNIDGDREKITETAKNYALALAIKKLKKYN